MNWSYNDLIRKRKKNEIKVLIKDFNQVSALNCWINDSDNPMRQIDLSIWSNHPMMPCKIVTLKFQKIDRNLCATISF